AAGPEMRLVVDEQRRAEPFGQPAEVAAADRQAPVGRDGRRGRQQAQVDGGAQEAAAESGPRPASASASPSAGRSSGASGSAARASSVLTRAIRSSGSNGFVT